MERIRKTMKVDVNMLPVKGFYFCLLGGTACLMPFIAIYMKMLGLTMSETALICGAMPFIHSVTRTIISGCVDKINAHQSMLIILCLMSAVFHGCMVFIPRRPSQQTPNRIIDVELPHGFSDTYLIACSGHSFIDDGSDQEGRDSHYNILFANDDRICRCTCNIVKQDNKTCQTQHVRRGCSSSSLANTTLLDLSKLRLANVDNCRLLRSRHVSCRCYDVDDLPVGGDICEKIAHDGSTRLKCKTNCSDKVDLPFDGLILKNKSQTYQHRNESTDKAGFHFGSVFWSVGILYFLGQFTMQPIYGINDALTYISLGEKRNKWGKQRLWGTVAYAVFGPFSGLLMDLYKFGDNEYSMAFLLFFALMTLSVVCACQFTIRRANVRDSSKVFSDIVNLLRKPEPFVLLSLVLVFGVYNGFISSFLFWHLKLLGDVPQLLLGLCILTNSTLEIVVMFFSERVFQTIGHVNSFSVVFVVYAIRMTTYSLIQNPWTVLFVEPLNAVTFGLMYTTASTYACRITPPGAHCSVQNIVSSVHFCFGKSIGTLSGGALYERYGGATTFRIFAASSIIFLVLHIIAHTFWIKNVDVRSENEPKAGRGLREPNRDDYEETDTKTEACEKETPPIANDTSKSDEGVCQILLI